MAKGKTHPIEYGRAAAYIGIPTVSVYGTASEIYATGTRTQLQAIGEGLAHQVGVDTALVGSKVQVTGFNWDLLVQKNTPLGVWTVFDVGMSKLGGYRMVKKATRPIMKLIGA